MSHYKPYPAYKDSGVEWLGRVPEHWEVSPLKYVVTFRSGGTPSKDKLEFWNGDIPWASAKDLKRERLEDTQDHLTGLAVTSGAAVLVPAGSVLVVVRGMILARIFPVAETMVPMAINQDLKALQASQKLEGRFLAQLLRGLAEESLRRLEEAGHGTKALRMDAWTSMQLTVPPIAEQLAILAHLDRETARIDALIEKKTRFIELLREKRQALITHAVTKGLDPNVKMKDSGVEWLGEVPEHWGIRSFKHLASIRYGIGEPPAYKPEGTPLIRATNVDAGCIRADGLVYVDPADIPEKRIVWLIPGDIIVVRSGAYTGDSAIIRDEHCPSIAGFDMVIRAHGISPNLLQYALLSEYLKANQIDLEKMRAAQPHLNAEELGACFVLVPPNHEQQEVVDFLNQVTKRVDSLIAKTKHSIALLKERRSALITAAVTGQIDLRETV